MINPLTETEVTKTLTHSDGWEYTIRVNHDEVIFDYSEPDTSASGVKKYPPLIFSRFCSVQLFKEALKLIEIAPVL